MRLNRMQRVGLFMGTTLWFVASVLSYQRNYQDTWILEDVFWAFAVYVAVFLLMLIQERDNRVVALLTAAFTIVVASIAGLKYVQPYGTSIDSAVHFLAVDHLVNTGRVVGPENVYSSIPGMHVWLASLAMLADLSAEQVIKYGLPLTAGLLPLVIYWLTRRAEMPANVAKYTIALSAFTLVPYHSPYGTGFSLVPLLILLGAALIREYYSPAASSRLAYTVLILIGLLQLVIWHSTTPMILPLLLLGLSLTPVTVQLVRGERRTLSPATSMLRLALLAGVLFVAYHSLEASRLSKLLIGNIRDLLYSEEAPSAILPARAFEISPFSLVRVVLIIHGRDFLAALLGLLGILVIWWNRRMFRQQIPLYAFVLVLSVVYGMLVLGALTGLDYERFIVTPIFLSLFFSGAALWWLNNQLRAPQWLRRAATGSLVVLAVFLGVVQFFEYQPLMPKARALAPETEDEYVLMLQGVNTAYQKRMLTFAEGHTDMDVRFASDLRSQRQFLRYYGNSGAMSRRLYAPLQTKVPVESTPAELFLLHWPGPAGGLSEQVEYRSTAKLTELRSTPGWDLIYDNGESFILSVR